LKLYKYNKFNNNSINERDVINSKTNDIENNNNNNSNSNSNSNNNYSNNNIQSSKFNSNTSLINLKFNSLNLNVLDKLNLKEALNKEKIKNNNSKEKEKENKFFNSKFILEKGKCFGDYNIIYQNKRSSIAKAIEDTICIGIPFDKFEYYFSDCILRKERERSLFLKEKLNIKNNEKIFEEFYKKMEKIVKKRQ
jgi:CRP-like cAMP-binding protein